MHYLCVDGLDGIDVSLGRSCKYVIICNSSGGCGKCFSLLHLVASWTCEVQSMLSIFRAINGIHDSRHRIIATLRTRQVIALVVWINYMMINL